MNKNWIHLFKIKNDHKLWEGIYVNTINGWHVFQTTDYMAVEPCRRFVHCDDLEWAKPVMEETRLTSYSDYKKSLRSVQ